MSFISAASHSHALRKSVIRTALMLFVLMLSASLVACGGLFTENESNNSPDSSLTESDFGDSNFEQREPAESEPAESEPAESEPILSEPNESEPAESEPAESEPAESEPILSEPNESEPAVSGPATLVVVNESADDTICQLYFSRTTNDDWENNRLGGLFSSLDPGESESFEVEADEYDIRMEDCDHNLLLQEMSVVIENEHTVRYAGRGNLDSVLTVSNESRQDICWVYFSPTTSDSWGGDQLGVRQVLEPRQTRTFEVASGTYDILLADCDQNTLFEEYEINISGEYTVNYTE